MANKPMIHPSPATIAAKAAHYLDVTSGAIVPGIQPSTTFARDDRYEPINAAYVYGRDQNPSVEPAEQTLCELEKGESCLLFASGMAAIAAVFHCLSPGQHVVLPNSMYWGTFSWTRDYADRKDISVTYYQPDDINSLREAVRDRQTRLVWVETPSNPYLHVTDIASAAQIAQAAGAALCVDSTAATPVFSQPLELGADIVMHSATKYLNGHSDVLAGALVARDEQHPLWESIVRERHDAGAVLGSFEAWLLMRGMRTMYLRVQRAAESAMKVARFLHQHPQVEQVLYPGLPDHPGHAIATQQMHRGYGGLLSFLIKGDAAQARQVAGALQLIISATSLGGVETLIEHRHSVEPPETGIAPNLLRLSVGIEDADDLIADLDQALTTR